MTSPRRVFGFAGEPAEADGAGPLPLDRSVVSVACGEAHMSAVTAAGRAFCWGWNGLGQCGQGHTDDVGAPAAVAVLSDGCVQTACGAAHTVVVARPRRGAPADRSAFAFGAAGRGQLGHAVPPEPPSRDGPSDAAALAAGAGRAGSGILLTPTRSLSGDSPAAPPQPGPRAGRSRVTSFVPLPVAIRMPRDAPPLVSSDGTPSAVAAASVEPGEPGMPLLGVRMAACGDFSTLLVTWAGHVVVCGEVAHADAPDDADEAPEEVGRASGPVLLHRRSTSSEAATPLAGRSDAPLRLSPLRSLLPRDSGSSSASPRAPAPAAMGGTSLDRSVSFADSLLLRGSPAAQRPPPIHRMVSDGARRLPGSGLAGVRGSADGGGIGPFGAVRITSQQLASHRLSVAGPLAHDAFLAALGDGEDGDEEDEEDGENGQAGTPALGATSSGEGLAEGGEDGSDSGTEGGAGPGTEEGGDGRGDTSPRRRSSMGVRLVAAAGRKLRRLSSKVVPGIGGPEQAGLAELDKLDIGQGGGGTISWREADRRSRSVAEEAAAATPRRSTPGASPEGGSAPDFLLLPPPAAPPAPVLDSEAMAELQRAIQDASAALPAEAEDPAADLRPRSVSCMPGAGHFRDAERAAPTVGSARERAPGAAGGREGGGFARRVSRASSARSALPPSLQRVASGAPASPVSRGAGSPVPGGARPSPVLFPGDDEAGSDAQGPAGSGTASRASTLGVGPVWCEHLAGREARSAACGAAHAVVAVAAEWVADADTPACMRCRAAFRALAVRRHHCCACGGVFCERCTVSRMPLLRLGYIEAVRVCDGCFVRLSQEDGEEDGGGEEGALADATGRQATDTDDAADGVMLRALAAELEEMLAGAHNPRS